MDKRKLLQYGACVLAITLSSGCGSQKEREQQYLDKAQSYFKAENLEKAKVELKNVLQINPKNTEAVYLMAQLAEKDKDWQKMFGLLQNVITEQPDNFSAQAKLGKLFLLGNAIDKANEKADLILAKAPNNIAGMTLKAAVYLRQHELAKAEALAQTVLKLEPGNVDATYLILKVYDDAKKYTEALALAEAGFTLHPEEVNLALVKLQLLVLTDKKDQIDPLVHSLQQQNPKNTSLHYSLVKLYLQLQQQAKAEQLLQDLIGNLPDDTKPKLALIEFFVNQNQVAKAEAVLKDYIKNYPQEYDFSFALVNLYKDNEAQAIAVLHQIISSDHDDGASALKAKNILALNALRKNDKKTARELVEAIIKADQHNMEALLLRASFAIDEDKNEAAIADLRTVLRDHPDAENAYILMSKAQQKAGLQDLSLESLEKALTINPNNVGTRISLAKIFAQKKDDARVLKLLNEVDKTQAQNAEVVSALAEYYASKQDWVNAETTAKSIAQTTETGLADFKLGQIYFAQKKYPQALEAFETVLKKKPLAIDILANITDVHLALGDAAKANERLNNLVKQHPDNFGLLNLRGQLYKQQKQFPEAEKLYSDIIKRNKNADFAYKNLAEIYFLQNQVDKGLASFLQAQAAMPQNIDIKMALAEIYDRMGKTEDALAVYKAALSLSPENKLVANNLAALTATTTTDPAKLKAAFESVKGFKTLTQPGFLDTYAWLAYLNGDMDTALSSMEKVIKIAPDFPEFNYHLGVIYAAKGRTAEAKIALDKALSSAQQYRWTPDAKAALSKLKS